MERESREEGSPDSTANHQVEAERKEEPGRTRVFEELFAGVAGLTDAVRTVCQGWAVARDPHDEVYGSDLGNGQKENLRDSEIIRPDSCHM